MVAPLPKIRTVRALRARVKAWRDDSETIALVPTMGALHQGHLSLVDIANKKADRTIVTIFVNPAQFAPNEDFSSYPRDEKRDNAALSERGTDLVFSPNHAEIYPPDFSTSVSVGGLSEGLCGASRPHFFGGVATVVTKLLLQALPDIAVFGEKDYQQQLIIRRLVRDLNIPVKIVTGPIIREADGLAMSSRNAYLSTKDRAAAPRLYQTLRDISAKLASGKTTGQVLPRAKRQLKAAGFEIDYLEVMDPDNLIPIKGRITGKARLFAAATLGATRLIDNLAVPQRRRAR